MSLIDKTNLLEQSKHWREGYAYAMNGLRFADCPYNVLSNDGIEWVKGYTQGRKELRTSTK